jgi:3,2-trans-enoyl-CoA isomerase
LQFHSPPVNVMSHVMIKEVLEQLHALAQPESGCKGIVVTSTLPTVFSAGIDLTLLMREDEHFDDEHFSEYWGAFQELVVTLHSYPLPLVAAITGHALGGGFLIPCCCDYRVMARMPKPRPECPVAAKDHPVHPEKQVKPFKVGVPVTRAGFAPPPFIAKTVSYLVGKRLGEDLIVRGTEATADEALKLGLVDEVVDEPEQAVLAAVHEVERYLELPGPYTRWLIKDHMRRPLVYPLRNAEARKQDYDWFVSMIREPHVIEAIRKYMNSKGSKKQQ